MLLSLHSNTMCVYLAFCKDFLTSRNMPVQLIQNNILCGLDHPPCSTKSVTLYPSILYEIKLGISGEVYSLTATVFLPFPSLLPLFHSWCPCSAARNVWTGELTPPLLSSFLSFSLGCPWVSMGSCSYPSGQHSVAMQLPEKKHMLLLHRQSLPVCSSDAVA